MNGKLLPPLNLVLSFYLVGAIWAVEVHIFRSWKLVGPKDFRTIKSTHWHKLPHWIFIPLALALLGSISLIWCRPQISPAWAVWEILGAQIASDLLTALF